MKNIFLPVLAILGQLCQGQANHSLNTCSNWLKTPSRPSYIKVGQLNVPGNQITVEATLNRTTPYSGGQIYAGDIVSKHINPADVNYLLRPNNAEITTSNGYFRTPEICEIELNKTYHVAMVYDGITLKFYRNGFLMSQVAATGDLYQNSYQTTIGYYDNQFVNTNFIGFINEVRIWNIVRTQSAIRTYMNSALPNPTTQPGLLAYYTFDNLLNKQGNSSWNGTIVGSATINETNPNCTFIADSCYVPTSINNIINDYTEVLGFEVCKNELIVADASNYNPGDTVLLIQMKGAIIDSGNTPGFGTVTNYKNAGSYEYNYIKQKNGNVIELKNLVTRQYDIPTGKVQLVRVPYYKSVNINDTLTCLSWDGSKGGILAFNVEDTLVMNADIDVTGKGFDGGKVINPKNNSFYCHENNYYYPNDLLKSAPKGEGIANVSYQKNFGKGAASNGGGGGLEHNSGGAGGSNITNGGNGGKEWITCGPPIDNGGIGGKALIYSNTLNRIFLGGGGGAGHCDNLPGFNPDGGNGGGIVIIKANFLKTNNNLVISNGAPGIECVKDGQAYKCHEGMGGGGGGGTILLDANNFLDDLQVHINGGQGADMNGELQGQLGPGGGGGGGLFWFSNSVLPANIIVTKKGGLNGVNIDFGNDAYGATPGQDGLNMFNLKIPLDTILFRNNIDSVRNKDSAVSCSTFDFKGLAYTNSSSITTWQWTFGDGGFANTQNSSHTYANSGSFTVKLVATDINGCKDSMSKPVTTSTVNIIKSNDTSLCGSAPVQLVAGGGSSYSWAPASTLNNPNISNPVATPSATILYYVTVTNSLGCSRMDSIEVTVDTLPVISKSNDTSVCSNSPLQLFAGGGASYSWTPASSLNNPNIPNPTATPSNTTTYYVTVTNGASCSKRDSIKTTVLSLPVIEKSNDTGICSSPSVQLFAGGGSAYSWTPSSTLNNPNISDPVATPPATTTYYVTVTSATGCSKVDSIKISVGLPVISKSNDTSICNNSSIQLFAGGGISYSWTPSSTLNNSNIFNPVATPSEATTYYITVFNSATCSKKDSIKISTIQAPQVNATKSNDIGCLKSSAQLNATGAINYSWTPATGLSNSSIANPLSAPGNTTLYKVIGNDINGCSNSDTVTVKVDYNMKALYLMPNSFTPNRDGINDCFGIKYWGTIQDLDFSIYNRFGERVFYTSDAGICWDGRYKQNLQDTNVYVYIIKAKTDCGQIERKGTVALLK